MARTTQMKLIELMILKEDISKVIEYLGKKGSFQFQTKLDDKKSVQTDGTPMINLDKEFFDKIQNIRNALGIADRECDVSNCSIPTDEDRNNAAHLISAYDELTERIQDAASESEKVNNAYKEALAFANLKVPYSELEHLSFLSLKIGKINPENFDDLKEAVGGNGIIIALGEDKSHILAASSKKGRFALETELKNFDFVNMEIPKDFNGVPDDVLEGLKIKKSQADSNVEECNTEKINFASSHEEMIFHLLGCFAIGMQVCEISQKLDSTELVYRITGWIPASEAENYISDLDALTEKRIAVRQYDPFEVPSVISGKEEIPVKLTHGKFVGSFERMILSYGAPAYGTIDPTPFVAVFFTILFGFMFGDLGQGLFIMLFGFLMSKKVIKFGGWNKFAPIFMAVGLTSSIMGLLTGECFSNETLLEPFQLWVTGLFGNPHAPIVKMMPSSDPKSIVSMFAVFGVAVGVGFVINSIGLLLNIINNIIQKKYGNAFFGKTGLAGALWFWYVVIFAVRIAFFGHTPQIYDWIIIGVTLFFAAFGEPFERLLNGERPVVENGVLSLIIGGIVELIEVISTYMSNSVSFVRVGAFALSHAVLDFIVLLLTEMVGGGVAGIAVLIFGNALIIVLEGMIVTIQCVRLQYYEFFSKFFTKTGREFKPFTFKY